MSGIGVDSFDNNNDNNNNLYSAVHKNELTALYDIKGTEGQFIQKYRQTIFLMYYVHIHPTTERKQQHSTDKDTTSKLKHSTPLTLREKKK